MSFFLFLLTEINQCVTADCEVVHKLILFLRTSCQEADLTPEEMEKKNKTENDSSSKRIWQPWRKTWKTSKEFGPSFSNCCCRSDLENSTLIFKFNMKKQRLGGLDQGNQDSTTWPDLNSEGIKHNKAVFKGCLRLKALIIDSNYKDRFGGISR